ncbi:hypothetical protein STEG23_024727 [Scotinomys teguina]
MKQSKDKDGKLESCAFVLDAVHGPVEITDFIKPFDRRGGNDNNPFALALAFSVDEVNRNPDLLPNMSLVFGFIGGDCNFTSKAHTIIQSSVKTHYNAPNYHCTQLDMCSVVLSGPSWSESLVVGKAIDLYNSNQVVQLTFGPFHPILGDHEQFPYLYQMAPKDTSLALAMISLMLHFSWSWVGLTISDNDQGIQFLSYLRREMEENIVCFAFVNMIPVNMHLYMSKVDVYYNRIMASSSNVVIIYGDTDSTLALSFRRKTHFTYPVGDKGNMKQKENLQAEYDLFHVWNFPYGLGLKMPSSVCSADCGPGFRQSRQEGMTVCCFDCSPCPENEVSNETNVDQCVKCPEDQYANA